VPRPAWHAIYGERKSPKPGDFVVMLDGAGRRRFIWRTTEATTKPLVEVDEATRARGTARERWWLDAHCRYFVRQAARKGFELSSEILTVFERFEVVWPLDLADIDHRADFSSPIDQTRLSLPAASLKPDVGETGRCD
jgi:hypothetical protein